MRLVDTILSALAFVGFVGAFPQLWGSDWRRIWLYHCKGIIPWSAAQRGIQNIMNQLREQNFCASLIVGVGRGGIICAGLLCSELTGRELVERSKEKQAKARSPKIRLDAINSTVFLKEVRPKNDKGESGQLVSRVDKIELSDINVDIREDDKIVLIVAQSYTGGTLEKATDVLLKKGAKRENIKTATLFWHQHQKINMVHEPDIFGMVMPLNKTPPWKLHDISTDRY